MYHPTAHYSRLLRNFIWPRLKLYRRSNYFRFLVVETSSCNCQRRCKTDSSLFVPIPLQLNNNREKIDIGEELTNKLKKDDILKLLNQFYKRPEIKRLSEENGLDGRLFNQTFISFRRYCLESDKLPVDLHIIFNDILQSAGHVDDIFPYFLRHAQQIFPHLSCMDDLRKISDLRLPANWYPEARAITRKIIFHAGPTNSGKTYHALERFIGAKSGVYCGPLKMLAVEVHSKTNVKGTPCDLVTGEERLYANSDQSPATHVACTVEMTNVNAPYEVAVIDEIQMIKDMQRGWAWTRALLGLVAEEIHICGEYSALQLVKDICSQIGEEVEVRKYKRLTQLSIEDTALGSLDKVQAGDCIVCFSKADIYSVSRHIEANGKQCAVIYGGLPPGTKLAQANKFNDPNDPCKILVATDAIGMGLNLSIRRIIFYSLVKPTINEQGEKEMDTLSTSQALQIGGRAGRFGTQFSEGYVTTFKHNDLQTLKAISERTVEPITAAGLHPTADQIELFAYHLPQATLSNLLDIFVSLSQMDDSHYFMCDQENFKFLADMIQHVPLPLRARYVFCCAPINKKFPFVCSMFLKFARQYSKNQGITFDWLCNNLSWPFSPPSTIVELVHLESVFDILDVYLWLSYRFPDLFPDVKMVRDMQHELDSIIQLGVMQITHLLKNTDKSSTHLADEEDSFLIRNKKAAYNKGKRTQEHIPVPPIDENETAVGLEKSKADKGMFLKHNRLTDRLLAQGLITTEELKELQKEWHQQQLGKSLNSNNNSPENESLNSTDALENETTKRKPKKKKTISKAKKK